MKDFVRVVLVENSVGNLGKTAKNTRLKLVVPLVKRGNSFMRRINLIILGEPMGKQRPRATRIGKRVSIYNPKETTTYENKIVNEYRRNYGDDKVFADEVPLFATIKIVHKLEKQHIGKRGINKTGQEKLSGKYPPMKKPDIDNVAKICLDALNGVAYDDDKCVVALFCYKEYHETKEYVEITIEEKPKNGKD